MIDLFSTPRIPTPNTQDLMPAIWDRLPAGVRGFAQYFLTYGPLATVWSADGAPYMLRVSLAQRAVTDRDVLDGPYADFIRHETDVCTRVPPRPVARWSQAYRFDSQRGWEPCANTEGVVLELFLPPTVPNTGFWAVVTCSKGRQHTLGRYTGVEMPITKMEQDVATAMQLVTPLGEQLPNNVVRLSA